MQSQTLLSQAKTIDPRVFRTHSFDDTVSNIELDEFPRQSNKQAKHIAAAQEHIWQFFINLVKATAPELVLTEFGNLFINPSFSSRSEMEKALKIIVVSHNEREFRNTLKRCIYILLNTWIYSRKYQYAQSLIEKLSVHHLSSSGASTLFLRTLKSWMMNFINSRDYQEVKLFASKYDHQETGNWKFRYNSYLLTPQYLNSHNSVEQRQAARRLSQQLQDKYKFDLAMYTAHAHTSSRNGKVTNPTALGDEALRLIKKVLAKQGFFNHVNLAAIFLNQTQGLSYSQFKISLLTYLIFSLESAGLVKSVKMYLTQKLDALYQYEDQQVLRNGLILRTANRMIEYLIIDKNNQPSDLFVLMASQGNALTLGILILKLLLISPPSRIYLDLCLSKLIDFYQDYSEPDCQWVINFLEVIKIILTLYTENVKYNLVNIDGGNLPCQTMIDKDGYRIFCQTYAEINLSQM